MTNANALAAATGLMLLYSSSTIVHAQTGMSVNVPFDFYVGSQRLPAGTYDVAPFGNPGVVRVLDDKGHTSVWISNGITNKRAAPKGKLVFNRYGQRYFLSEVHWIGSLTGNQLPKSKFEAETAKNSHAERVAAVADK